MPVHFSLCVCCIFHHRKMKGTYYNPGAGERSQPLKPEGFAYLDW